jgi:hypothetical protein
MRNEKYFSLPKELQLILFLKFGAAPKRDFAFRSCWTSQSA